MRTTRDNYKTIHSPYEINKLVYNNAIMGVVDNQNVIFVILFLIRSVAVL